MHVRHRKAPARGFTLVELGVVMLIIGLLVSFILVAGLESAERAKSRAAQGLVGKLEVAVNDRLEALTNLRADLNNSHRYLASSGFLNGGLVLPSDPRAQVIAQAELIKAEMPDVFFVQVALPISGSELNIYPLNFAGRPYTGGQPLPPAFVGSALSNYAQHVLPLGNTMLWDPIGKSFGGYDPNDPSPAWKPAGYGIHGASYVAAAGLLKNLGNVPVEALPSGNPPQPLYPWGYDGVDNDGDGLVDELEEGLRDPATGQINPAVLESVNYALSQHTHKTARAEMLYALLVEGQGPYGSVFTTDDFADTEIGDTDGDGLPEFIDPYGEPLQFFRWPTHYASDFQRGALSPTAFDGLDNNGDGVIDIYGGDALEATTYPLRSTRRDANPLDPNSLLVAPAWWGEGMGARDIPSPQALIVQGFFFGLIDPLALQPVPATPLNTVHWDRNGYYKRRAFLFKPLILSAGADRIPGVPLMDSPANPWITSSTNAVDNAAASLILIEGQAAPFSPLRLADRQYDYQIPDFGPVWAQQTQALVEAGLDDISNHNFQASGGTLAQ